MSLIIPCGVNLPITCCFIHSMSFLAVDFVVVFVFLLSWLNGILAINSSYALVCKQGNICVSCFAVLL